MGGIITLSRGSLLSGVVYLSGAVGPSVHRSTIINLFIGPPYSNLQLSIYEAKTSHVAQVFLGLCACVNACTRKLLSVRGRR